MPLMILYPVEVQKDRVGSGRILICPARESSCPNSRQSLSKGTGAGQRSGIKRTLTMVTQWQAIKCRKTLALSLGELAATASFTHPLLAAK